MYVSILSLPENKFDVGKDTSWRSMDAKQLLVQYRPGGDGLVYAVGQGRNIVVGANNNAGMR